MNTSLTTSERREIDEIALKIQELSSIDELEDYTVNVLPGFLSAEFASWNEHDATMLLTRVQTSRLYQQKVLPLIDALNRSLPTHPLFRKYVDFEKGTVRLIHEIDRTREGISAEQLHATDFYQNVAQHLEIEDQLLAHLFIHDGVGVLLTFHGKQEFSPNDVLKATILRTHLMARFHFLHNAQAKAERERQKIQTVLIENLTRREIEIVPLICLGQSNSEIAAELGIASRTVDTHISNILRKLDVRGRTQIISRFATVSA